MKDRKRGDAPFLIVKYLVENGPATYDDLSKNIPLPQRTVEYGIREILLKRFELVKKLPNDKYSLKWYDEEKGVVENLKRKLLRNPTPEELAGLIRRTTGDAKDLLVKYITGYREPTEYEIESSAKALWKRLVWSSVKLPGKKAWFEKGIVKVKVEGIDSETLDEILNNRPSVSLDGVESYLVEFPKMIPKITPEPEINQIAYKIEWNDDAKQVLCPIDFWNQTAEIQLPRRFDKEEVKWTFCYNCNWEAIEIARVIAEIYVPSDEIIEYLLSMVGLPDMESDLLNVLKKFCENALEVDQLSEKTKEMIVSKLIDVAFIPQDEKIERHYENAGPNFTERNNAFGIIQMLNIRNQDFIDIAKDYLFYRIVVDFDSFPFDPIKGPDIFEVAEWLAKDSKLKTEIGNKIDEVLKNADLSTPVVLCAKLLKRFT